MHDFAGAVNTPVPLAVETALVHAEVDGALSFDPTDPFAVTLTVAPSMPERVTWTFARELLEAGVMAPAGYGDVTVEPCGDREIRITLAGDKVASMTLSLDAVAEFLIATYAVVPSGSELDHVDLDAQIAALLS